VAGMIKGEPRGDLRLLKVGDLYIRP
jgi:hypothetical protein